MHLNDFKTGETFALGLADEIKIAHCIIIAIKVNLVK